jgi:hypothetical protein
VEYRVEPSIEPTEVLSVGQRAKRSTASKASGVLAVGQVECRQQSRTASRSGTSSVERRAEPNNVSEPSSELCRASSASGAASRTECRQQSQTTGRSRTSTVEQRAEPNIVSKPSSELCRASSASQAASRMENHQRAEQRAKRASAASRGEHHQQSGEASQVSSVEHRAERSTVSRTWD